MSYRSSLPVVLMSMVGLVAVGLLAKSGANKAAADSGSGDRLGCGTYCQDAGGYNGPAGDPWHDPWQPDADPAEKVASGTVRVDDDGYVPVTVTCASASLFTCQGRIVLSIDGLTNPPDVCGGGHQHWAGCSDLLVNSDSTRTIGVPLTPAALAYARAHSPVTVDASVDDMFHRTSHGTLQVFAP